MSEGNIVECRSEGGVHEDNHNDHSYSHNDDDGHHNNNNNAVDSGFDDGPSKQFDDELRFRLNTLALREEDVIVHEDDANDDDENDDDENDDDDDDE